MKPRLFFLISGLILGLLLPVVAMAQGPQPPGPPPVPTPQMAPLNPEYPQEPSSRKGFIPPSVDLSHVTGQNLPLGLTVQALPSRWDWREAGKVTSVKNQGSCGSCYAFASIGNIESRLLVSNTGTFDFSENNVKECNWYEVTGTEGGTSCSGGNYLIVADWLSKKGTVLESCDPYVASDVDCKTSCPYQKTLLDWRIISGNAIPATDVLKQYIYTYGPVYTSLYAGDGDAWDTEFSNYDGSYTLYYTGTQTPNHAVLIVGWDDNLSHSGGKGGWIVKNSWGTSWGGPCGYGSEGGYFTIAYGSASIGKYSSFIYAWQDYDNMGDLWFYDQGGWGASYGYGGTTAWALAHFTPTASGVITRVEFWTTDTTTDVDIYLYDNFDGAALSGLLAQTLNHQFSEPGYHSVPLASPLPVTAGNDVIAVVKFTNATYTYPVAVDYYGPKEGKTYISPSGSTWTQAPYDVGIRLRINKSAAPEAKVYLPLVLKNYPTSSGGWVTIVSTDFEGAFPSPWAVVDGDSSSNGEYYWAKRNCRPYAGSYSGWAVGGGTNGGALSCGSNYPNNAKSWMIYGPFSLVGATAGDLRFNLWLNTESNYDYVARYASIDGTNFYGAATSGNSNGWIDRVLDLTNVYILGNLMGQPNVWVALYFYSDSSINYPEGAYVDNIVLRKCTAASCPTAGGVEPEAGGHLVEFPASAILKR